MICHGYDYTVPNDGKWLGKPMAGLGIANKVLQKAIAHEMVDRLNTRLLNLANQSPRVTYVNVPRHRRRQALARRAAPDRRRLPRRGEALRSRRSAA